MMTADEKFDWRDTPGDSPSAVKRALTLVGGTQLDEPFACPVHGAHKRHEARVSNRDLLFHCEVLDEDDRRRLRLCDVVAALRMGIEPHWLRQPALAAAWWGRIWVDLGILALDLPRIELAPTVPNRRRVEPALRSLVLLQGIHSQGGLRQAMPTDFARPFALAWLQGIPGADELTPTSLWRSLADLEKAGYVTREKHKPDGLGRARWRYELTGEGLVVERPAHRMILKPEDDLEALAA
jgi:hypothetical protein